MFYLHGFVFLVVELSLYLHETYARSKKQIAQHFSSWDAVSIFDGFYIDKSVLRVKTVKDIVEEVLSLRINVIAAAAREEEEGEGAGGVNGSPPSSPLRQGWLLCRDLVARLSPLKMRFKDNIFILKHNSV